MGGQGIGNGVFTVQGVMLFLASRQDTVLSAKESKTQKCTKLGRSQHWHQGRFGMESGRGGAMGTWVLRGMNFEPYNRVNICVREWTS